MTKTEKNELHCNRKQTVNKPLIVVGIPAFNEENSIAKVVVQAKKYAENVVVCDDGSTDLTGAIAEKLGAYVIRHDKNRGYGEAIWSLICMAKESNADVLVTLDGDGQHYPHELAQIVDVLIQKEVDVVVGSRFECGENKKTMPILRKVGNKFFSKITHKFINSDSENVVTDVLSGFKCYNKNAINKINLKCIDRKSNVNIEIMHQIGKNKLSLAEAPISVKYSGLCKTQKRNMFKLGWQVLDTILLNIIVCHPLLSLLLPGFLFSLIGLFMSFSSLLNYFETSAFPIGWAIFGTSLLMLGLVSMSSGLILYAFKKFIKRGS